MYIKEYYLTFIKNKLLLLTKRIIFKTHFLNNYEILI